MRFLKHHAVATIATLILAACSSSGPGTISRPSRLQPVCDEATGQAATTGRASAQGYARAALRFRIEEVKGFLHTEGYRSVKSERARLSCRPYAIGPITTALTHCTAKARVCGN